MTIYVDQFPEWLGVPKKWESGGHLLTTDLNELHSFAKGLGLKREWFQDKTFPHYDLTATKRKIAITRGAVEIKSGEFPDDMLVKMGDQNYQPYLVRRILYDPNS
jgi:hypothetical protein